ncbi:MAG: hypothetical protein L3J15_04525 [Devosiaceae bacterium]|nr:hypothetical protein [Devosiaceae bacterium]
MKKTLPISAMLLLIFSTPAITQTIDNSDIKLNQSLSISAGIVAHNDIYANLLPVVFTSYEDNFTISIGYQNFIFSPTPDLRFGFEAGLSTRFGEKVTGEVWAGIVARYDGFSIGDDLRISPSLTFGVSAITDTIGRETDREAYRSGRADLLFYLSPEIAFSSKQNPNSEFFYRLHHRSGAWSTLGNMYDTFNAQTIGYRRFF